MDYAKYVNRTDLHFFYEDGKIENYVNQACLGALYGRTFENLHTVIYPFGSIESAFRPQPYVVNFYLDFLREQGFQGFDNTNYTAHPGQTPFCYAEWVSTFTALRYTYEPNSRLVQWWFDKVYQRPELNKWIVFVLAHLDTALGHGHTLIHSTVQEVPLPAAILSHLRTIHTGFTPNLVYLHALWGGVREDLLWVDGAKHYTQKLLDDEFDVLYEQFLSKQTSRMSWQ